MFDVLSSWSLRFCFKKIIDIGGRKTAGLYTNEKYAAILHMFHPVFNEFARMDMV